MKNLRISKKLAPLFVTALIAALMGAGSGCQAVTAPSMAVSALTSAGSQVVDDGRVLEHKGPEVKGSNSYFEFKDIDIPPGLSLNQDRTSVFSAGKQKAGVMVFDGYLDSDSLAAFFNASMSRHGWSLVGEIQMPAIKMFFSKETRTCVISITENTFNTEVVFTVTPTKIP